MKPDLEIDPWSHLVLSARVKESLFSVRRVIQDAASKRASIAGLNVLIYGPAGTGKTQIIRAFSQMEGVAFRAVWALDFKAGYIGQAGKRVRDVFEQARSSAPSILAIDLGQGASDDFLFGPRSSAVEINCEVVAQLDGLRAKRNPVFVIAEAFEPHRMDPPILSRFDVQIEIALPDESERQEILKQKIRMFPTDLSLDLDEVSAVLARNSEGDSGRWLEGRVRQAFQHAAESVQDPNEARLTRELLLSER
jgi:AAA+ superfamily predicted ATPase